MSMSESKPASIVRRLLSPADGGVGIARALLIGLMVAALVSTSATVVIEIAAFVPFIVSRELHRRLVEIGLVAPEAIAVGMIAERRAQIAVGAHLAITVVALERAPGRVDRDMVEIDPEPVTLGVAIGEQPRLQHFVR